MNTWESVCAKTITAFGGETPGAELEVEIAAAYERDPKRTQGAIDRTAALVKAGKARSGWAVLRAELAKQGPERRRKIRQVNAFDELANLEQAEAEAEDRARHFRNHFRCPDCQRIKLPWWTRCLQNTCVQKRSAEPDQAPTETTA